MLHNGLKELFYLCWLFSRVQEGWSVVFDVKKFAVFEKSSLSPWKKVTDALVSIVLLFLSHRSTLRTMQLVILVCQLVLILRTGAQIPEPCIISDTNRPPGLCHLFFFVFSSVICMLSLLLIYVLCFWKSLPENSDITVVCGTEYMDLSIYICPMYQALYNESLMVLNNEYNKPECFGTADWTVTPPVLKFRFPINESAIVSCNNNFKVFFTTDLPSLLINWGTL